MKNFNSLKDLIEDSDFMDWVHNPGKAPDLKWTAWVQENPEREEMIENAREILLALRTEFSPDEISPVKIERIWQRIQSATDDKRSADFIADSLPDEAYAERSGAASKYSGKTYYLVAAVTSLLLCILIFLGESFRGESKTQEIVYTSKHNPLGQKSKIQLPDGSVVFLNSESTIEFVQGFSDSTRTVRLAGEGFFEIAKDPLRPFIVEVSGLKVEALGTSFNIQSFHRSNVEIRLSSGIIAVWVTGTLSDVQLKPGEMVSWVEGSSDLDIEMIQPNKIGRWKDGYLVFRDDRFTEVVKTLERWYDVQISFSERDFGGKTCTAEFDNENLRNVLESLSYSVGFQYDLNGMNVKIRPDQR